MEELFYNIPNLIKSALISELMTSRPVLTYNGQQKTVGGRPVSPSPPVASGNLIKNMNVFWRDNDATGEPELIVEMPYYWYWVDKGRRPSLKMPPLRAIDKWGVTKQGLSNIRDEKGRFIPRRAQIFAYAKSIQLYGYKGTNFINNALTKVENKLKEEIGRGAAEYFRKLIKDQLITVNL